MTSTDFFNQISNHFANELPFVAYRKPNENSVKAMLQKDEALHITLDFSKSGFVFAPFDDRQNVILIPSDNSETIATKFVMSNESETSHNTSSVNEETKEKHINLVKKGINIIETTDLTKVVLSRKERITISAPNPIKIFKRLLNNYNSAFVYCWYHPSIGLWLGATPETLINVEGNRFITMALAGTQTYKGNIDVKWESKDIEEQSIVTKSIMRKLKQKSHTISVSEPKTIKAGELLHIQTKISGTILNKLEKINLELLLGSLHPTPAVCGSPQDTAKQFILENENYNREFYTGFLGELNIKQARGRNTNRRNVENNAYSSLKNTSSLFVNLRCMKLEDDQATLFVGGGITKDSIPEKEWEETVNKAKTMKRVIVF